MFITDQQFQNVIMPTVQAENNGMRLDSDETTTLIRELNAQEAILYEEDYAEQKHRILIPVDMSLPPGATTASFKIRSRVGSMRIIGNITTILPNVGHFDREDQVYVRSFGGEIVYSSDDLLAAALTGRPLESDQLLDLRLAHRQKEADLCWIGEEDYKIVGLFDVPDIPKIALPNGAAASPLWVNKTPLEIIADLNSMYTAAQENVNRLVKLNTMLMPGSDYDYISTTPFSTLDTKSILEVFMSPEKSKVHGITLIEPMVSELTNRFVAGTESGIFLYDRSPQTLSLKIAQDLTVFPVQPVGLNFRLPAKGRVAGVQVKRPQRTLIATGQS